MIKHFIAKITNNVIVLTIVFGVLALAGLIATCDFNVFFGIIGAFLTILLVINAMQQNIIQKSNIKLQMFDKRYAVLEAIAVSLEIVDNQDYSDFVLSRNVDPLTINKLITDARDNINKQTLLAQCLFDNELTKKVREINIEFQKVAKLHFELYKSNLRLLNDEVANNEYASLFSRVITATGDEKESLLKEISTRFPEITKNCIAFNEAVAKYEKLILDSRILKDFDKYIKIQNIDN